MPKDQETAILRFGFMARCRGPFKEETQAAKSESQHRAGVAKQGTEGMASHRGQGGPGEPQRAGHTGLAGDTWVLQSRGSPHIGYERTLRQGPSPHHHPLCSAAPSLGHHGEDTFLSTDNDNGHHRMVSKGALAGALRVPGPVLSTVHTLETRKLVTSS